MSASLAKRLRFPLRGRLISPAAREWLRRAANPTILSLYQSAANLTDESLGVLSLNLPVAGPGPFALVAQPEDPDFEAAGGFAHWLVADDRIMMDGSQLVVGSLSVDLTNLVGWHPSPRWEGVRRERLPARVRELSTLLREHTPEGSLAPLLKIDEGPDLGPEADLRTALLRAVQGPAASLLAGVLAGVEARIADASRRLAGLGGGVTPAGDDYMIGVMHALWALHEQSKAARISRVIARSSVPRTNRISAAWLKAAAGGEAAEPWHALLAALSDGAQGSLTEPGLRLIRVGHTSGADALTGFLGMVQAIGNEKLRWGSAQSGDAEGTA